MANQKLKRGPHVDRSITLPHAWTPYPWQADMLRAFERGIKRFLILVHRRAGKDQVGLNLAAIASQQRVGTYWHVYPYASQVRSAIWSGADKKDGVRFLDQAFPEQIRHATRHAQMELELRNGSIWRCLGSDNFEALRGGNPLGVVFSEFAFADPEAWSRIAPILRENQGWAAFITTPLGHNHCYQLYQAVKNNPEWYVKVLTVDDTVDNHGIPLILPAEIEAERRDGIDEASIRQEYYVDFSAVFKGAYYATELQKMAEQKRICEITYDPKRPVFCSWDLGQADEMVALFFQQNGAADYCIGSRSWQFTKYEDALGEIAQVFPWSVARHILPHDANKGSGQTGQTDAQAFESLDCEIEVVDRLAVQTGIQAVRAMMPSLWIDNGVREWAPTGNNSRLIDALGGYRTEGNAKRGVFSRTPLHSWESHFADALRYYALARAGGLIVSKWNAPPNYALQDRAVI